jgi:hypothetical protein
MPKDQKKTRVEIPADLSSLSDEELNQLKDDATAEFDGLDGDDNTDVQGLERMGQLADLVESVNGQLGANAQAAAEAQAARESLRGRIHADGGDEDGEAGEETDDGAEADATDPVVDAVTAGARPRRWTDVRDVIRNPREQLNVRLSRAAAHQPAASRRVPTGRQFEKSVLVASADIAGYSPGSAIDTMDDLIDAYKTRGRALPEQGSRALAGGRPIYGDYVDLSSSRPLDRRGYNAYGLLGHEGDWRRAPRYPIAQMKRDFAYMLDAQAKPEDAWEVMQAAAQPSALLAAGGWCSPSEISYDFYNIVAMDGAYDLPTTGIRRGGMRWPTSPSFGDLASSVGLWHWNETQDIAAVTGTAQSGTKTCARVPCAAFNEARLEGEGICITAGNLTTDAWPEQIANFLRLVNATHFHRVNSFFINNVIANSTAVTLTQTNSSPSTDILAAVEHQVWDLRTKYAMMDTDILEAVFPSWVLGLIRADISRRNGLDTPDSAFSVTNAQIASWFSERFVRVQFVQDFDVRGANQFGQSAALSAAWPATVRFLLYPAGTWLRGNGLNLDLGIIRDSTLNATNDYTAAWSEEFFLLAKIGHESRIVTLGASGSVPTGTTGLGLTATGV